VTDGLVNDGMCAHDFALKALEYRNNFDTVRYRAIKVSGCAHAFNFLRNYAAKRLHHKTPKSKRVKFGGLSCSSATE